PGHAHVHQQHVGTVLLHQGHRLVAVIALTDHLDAGVGAQDHRQPGAHQGVVIDQSHTRHVVVGHGITALTSKRPSSVVPDVIVPPEFITRYLLPYSAIRASCRSVVNLLGSILLTTITISVPPSPMSATRGLV